MKKCQNEEKKNFETHFRYPIFGDMGTGIVFFDEELVIQIIQPHFKLCKWVSCMGKFCKRSVNTLIVPLVLFM